MSLEGATKNTKIIPEINASKKKMTVKRKKFITDYFQPKNKQPSEMISRKVQADIDPNIPEDLINDVREKYWCMLAEVKRVELEDALIENARLDKIKDKLIKQNNHYKEMLDEANTFISFVNGAVEDVADDTGIGLANVDDSVEEQPRIEI